MGPDKLSTLGVKENCPLKAKSHLTIVYGTSIIVTICPEGSSTTNLYLSSLGRASLPKPL